MTGEVWVYIDGKLVDHGANAIQNDLKAHVAARMTAGTPNAGIDGGNRFSAEEQAFGGTEDGKDGILAIDNAGNEYTMVTEEITAVNQHAYRWRGELRVTGSVTMSGARLGVNFNSGSSPFFETDYATRTFSASHAMQADSALVVEWEIRMQAP